MSDCTRDPLKSHAIVDVNDLLEVRDKVDFLLKFPNNNH